MWKYSNLFFRFLGHSKILFDPRFLVSRVKESEQHHFLTFPACFSIPIFFSNLNYNCSNLLDMRNLQEQVKKAFCYQKLFWPITAWINCSSDLNIFANSRPSASNFKKISRSLKPKIQQSAVFLTKTVSSHSRSEQFPKQNDNFWAVILFLPYLNTWEINQEMFLD